MLCSPEGLQKHQMRKSLGAACFVNHCTHQPSGVWRWLSWISCETGNEGRCGVGGKKGCKTLPGKQGGVRRKCFQGEGVGRGEHRRGCAPLNIMQDPSGHPPQGKLPQGALEKGCILFMQTEGIRHTGDDGAGVQNQQMSQPRYPSVTSFPGCKQAKLLR